MSARLTGQQFKKKMEARAEQDEHFKRTTSTMATTTTSTTTKVNCDDHRRLNSRIITSSGGSGNLLLSFSYKKRNNNNNNKLNLMAAILTILTIQLTAVAQLSLAVMNLPDGIENILGFVPKSTFQCERDGYFGDIDNDCRIFHLCQRQVHPSGRTEWRHWTYACGNQTMFNQLTLTCAFVDEAIPCKHASQFQYLNEVIHRPAEPFLTDADVTSGISYYSNRVMSDGARARAFEDSQLLAQIGGGQQQPQQQQQATNTLSTFNGNNNNNFQQQGSSIAVDTTSFASQGGQLNGQLPRHSLPTIATIDTATEGRANNDNDNNINFIDQPAFQPNENNFQPLFNPRQQQAQHHHNHQQQQLRPIRQQLAEQPRLQFQPLQAASLPTSQPVGQATGVVPARGGLIENHAFQLQHHHHSSPTQTSFASPPNQQASFHAIQAASLPPPPPAPTTTTTTTTAATTLRSNPDAFNSNQLATTTLQSVQRLQPENVASSSNNHNANIAGQSSPSSFSFSLSTNHQPGAQSDLSSFSQSQGLLLSPPRQQQSSIFQLSPAQTPLVPTVVTTTTTTPFSVQPPALTTGFSTAFTQPQTIQTPAVATTTLASTPLTTITNLAPTTTDLQPVPVFTTQRLQPPTTTITSVDLRQPTTTATAASSSLRRRQDQPQASNRQQRDRAGNDLNLERAHVAFQSTRLSSQANNQPSNRAADTPIVMRRSPVNVTPPVRAASPETAAVGAGGQAATGTQSLESAQPWSANQFWRRSFDTQLLTPKFESMLTRRRV